MTIERYLEDRDGSASPATYNRVRPPSVSLVTTAARKGLLDSNRC